MDRYRVLGGIGIAVIVILALVVASGSNRLHSSAGVAAKGAAAAEEGLSPTKDSDADEPEYRIVTLLPKDAIPAIYNPRFVEGEEADKQYGENELVLGVEINGDVRAYSIPFLSGHEIVDDVVGGVPIAVTW